MYMCVNKSGTDALPRSVIGDRRVRAGAGRMDAGDHRTGNANIRQAQFAGNHIDDRPAYDQEIKGVSPCAARIELERVASSMVPGSGVRSSRKAGHHAAKIYSSY